MNNRKPIFFTSDLHLHHAKAIEYDNRPFKDVFQMKESLITRWNAVVPENGLVYILGDVGTDVKAIKDFLARTNGTKILIVGNHDKGYNSMYAAGFTAVLHGAVIYSGTNRITLSHCPLLDIYREDTTNMKKVEGEDPIKLNWHGETRPKHRACSMKDEGQFHLHGHIHSNPSKPQSNKIEGRQYDVGVCANNYRPVSLSEIESWINRGKLNND